MIDGRQWGAGLRLSRVLVNRPGATNLFELEMRAIKIARSLHSLPRQRMAAAATLDLLARDARHGSRCLNLHSRELEVVWHLFDEARTAVTRLAALQPVTTR